MIYALRCPRVESNKDDIILNFDGLKVVLEPNLRYIFLLDLHHNSLFSTAYMKSYTYEEIKEMIEEDRLDHELRYTIAISVDERQ